MSDDEPDTTGSYATAEAALAREIRRRRTDAGLSQAELANLVGYSREYVSRAERPIKGLASAGLVRAIDARLRAGGELVALQADLYDVRLARRRMGDAKQSDLAIPPATGLPTDALCTEEGVTVVQRALAGAGRADRPATGQDGRVMLPDGVESGQIVLSLGTEPTSSTGNSAAADDPAPQNVRDDPPTERAYELYVRAHGLLASNDKRRMEAATTLLDRALDIDPHFARAQAARGYAQWRRYFSGWGSSASNLELALSDVDAALRRDPNSIGARTTLIRVCWDMGWHERALEIGHHVYNEHPDSLDAALAFARALNNGGMAEVALPLTRSVLHVDPTNPTALKLLIWNMLMIGDFLSALRTARLYLPTAPRDSNTRWAVAMAHLGNNDVDEGIRTASEAVSADPDDITAWSLHGHLLRINGEATAAQAVWSSAITYFTAGAGVAPPLNVRMRTWLASIEACAGRADHARERILDIAEAEPHNGYVKYRIAHVLAELGDSASAIQALSEAVSEGFLSAQLLRQDECLSLRALVGMEKYRRVKRTLQENVEQVRSKFLQSVVGFESRWRQ